MINFFLWLHLTDISVLNIHNIFSECKYNPQIVKIRRVPLELDCIEERLMYKSYPIKSLSRYQVAITTDCDTHRDIQRARLGNVSKFITQEIQRCYICHEEIGLSVRRENELK